MDSKFFSLTLNTIRTVAVVELSVTENWEFG